MNILFINVTTSHSRYFPTGVAMLMTVLEKKGYNVTLFDTNFVEITDLKEFYSDYNELSIRIGQTKRINENFDMIVRKDFKEYVLELQKTINDHEPDMVGISTFSDSYPLALKLIQAVQLPEKSVVVMGGTHCKVAPEKVILESCVDYVFEYEAEETFLLLCELLNGNSYVSMEMIDGVYWKNANGNVMHNTLKRFPDITRLPIINLSPFDEKYFFRPFDGKMKKIINYEASRGCPYTCTYCINSMIHGEKGRYKQMKHTVRRKTNDQIIRELKHLIQELGFEMIVFMDELFLNQNLLNFKQFAAQYIQNIGIPFTISTRPETLNEEKVKLLKNMNCASVSIGVENGNELLRMQILNRRMKNDTIIQAFDLLNKYDIRNSSLNMIGSPGETEETIWDTIRLNRRLNPSTISVAVLFPYEGTSIRDTCIEKGYLRETDAHNFQNPIKTTVLDLPTISKEKIEEYYLNFINLCRAKQ